MIINMIMIIHDYQGGYWQPSRGTPCKYHVISITGKPMPIPEQRRHPRHSNNTSKFHEPSGPAIFQLNVEGLTRPKCEVIQKIAADNSIFVILLQETHASSNEKIKIYGYSLIDSIHHPKHGIATLVRNDLPASIIDHSREGSETEWLTISINGEISITNIYKPPNAPFYPPPRYEHPATYSGDLTVTIHPGVILETILLVQLFMIGQAPLTLSFYTILINRNRFTLQLGTPSPTQILRSTRMTSVAPYLTRYIMLLGTF